MKNSSYYCYLNALLQSLAPIDEMREHYLTQSYSKYKTVATKRDDFSFSNGLYIFFKSGFREKQQIIDVKFLK
jgi:hypothetical protein